MPWKGKLSIPDPVQHLDWIPAYAGMTDCRVNISDVSKTLSSRKLPKQLSGIQRTALALLNTTVEGQTSIPAPVQRLDGIPAYAGMTDCRVNISDVSKTLSSRKLPKQLSGIQCAAFTAPHGLVFTPSRGLRRWRSMKL